VISAAKLLLFSSLHFVFGKIKRNPIIFIELQCGVERFPGLAFEAFDDGCFTFGQQVRNL
jgi:hypothetical protein